MAYTTIDDPSLYFRVKAFEGNASNDHAITWDETHANMQPDLLWFKSRDNAQSHALWDSVRGASLRLLPNSTGTEGTEATNLDSFDSNGFQVDNEAIVNHDSMVCWGWKESATAGFDIVIYTGDGSSTSSRTISHGLSATPGLIINKNRSDTGGWMTWHQNVTSGQAVMLQSDEPDHDSGASGWAQGIIDSSASSSVYGFTAGHSNDKNVNESSDNYITYLWAEKQGFSKFGKYTGNGNADGTFVYTGFLPAFIMIKRIDSAGWWNIIDNKRLGYNVNNPRLYPNTNGAEDAADATIDILSNGFKARATSQYVNYSAGTYVYAAFAEAPFVNSEGVPCNAR